MSITELREDRKMSGAEFARLIGASAGQLHDWESGRQPMTIEAAVRIEDLLGVSGLVEWAAETRAAKARAA